MSKFEAPKILLPTASFPWKFTFPTLASAKSFLKEKATMGYWDVATVSRYTLIVQVCGNSDNFNHILTAARNAVFPATIGASCRMTNPERDAMEYDEMRRARELGDEIL